MTRTGFQKINQAADGKAEGEKGGMEIKEIHKSLLITSTIKMGQPPLKESNRAPPTKHKT